jgi:hypothetical protein
VAIGCSSSGTGGQPCLQYAGAGNSPTSSDAMCVNAGGVCATNAGALCAPGTHEILTGQGACGYPSYGGGGNTCGPQAGPASLPYPCCAPGDAGVDGDALADGAGDAAGDAPDPIGSCQGEPCNGGCSCGILPQTGKPSCFCEGADGGTDGGASEAGAPTCGTIWCFNGCQCNDVQKSECVCP